ncbi:MAG: AI-2E family transporter [Chloroflexota bacterium]
MTSKIIRHWRLESLALGIAVVFLLLYVLRGVLLPFAVGLVLAYLLLPAVSWLERHLPRPGKWCGFKRIFSVLMVFLLLFGILAAFSYFIATAVIDASIILLENAPYYLGKSLFQVQEWFEGIREQFPPEIRQEVDQALIEGGVDLGRSIRTALMGGIAAVPRTFTTILGFASLPFFLFYVLKDSEKLKVMLNAPLPHGVARHVRNVVNILEMVLGRYIRAQLLLGAIVAYLVFVGLLVLDIQFAAVLALLAGISEFIPTLGPWLGGAVAVIVTLAVSPDKVLWVVLLYLGVQMVENYFLVPRIQSAYLRIHPALMIVILVLGAYLAGFWGLLLAAPLAATVMEIVRYVYQEYKLEEASQ